MEGEGTREALTAARERLESLLLSHPNVARLLAIGTQHMPAVRGVGFDILGIALSVLCLHSTASLKHTIPQLTTSKADVDAGSTARILA